MAAEPRVSVVVTCYQQADYVEEALDSVAAQTFGDWHLVVTDDASTDDSVEVIQRWVAGTDRPVDLVLHEDNTGLTTTLNDALAHCRGEYLAYLGGDDVWHPTKLARLVAALDGRPGAVVAFSDARLIDADGSELGPSFLASIGDLPPPEGDVFEELLRRNFVIASSAVYRRAAVEAVGGWDPALPFEDWDLLLHLADRGPMVAVTEALVDYRVHDASLTRSHFSLMIQGRMAVIEKWLGRDPAHDALILPYLRFQSWRLYKVHPDRARPHLAVAYAGARGPRGRARYLIATRPAAERAFEAVRRVWQLRLRVARV